MPRILGNFTVGEKPFRVNISEWLMPRPITLTSDHPGLTSGVSTSVYISFSGPPGSYITTAFMLPSLISEDVTKEVPLSHSVFCKFKESVYYYRKSC